MIKVCLKFNSSFINFVSIVLSIIIVTMFSLGLEKIRAINIAQEQSIVEVSKEKIESTKDKIKENKKVNSEEYEKLDDYENLKEEKIENEFDWYIEIPKIKLYAPIEEGTEDEILNQSVGHFENTSRRNGNCGLAAHNRGYNVNYFENVKELENNDTIFYFVDGKKYEYRVSDIVIIYETDWSYLEETEDDRITLITCVENRPEYRLCVQGKRVEE